MNTWGWRLSALLLAIAAIASAAIAAAATAGTSPITATVTPDKPGAASGVSITISGPLPQGLPQSLELTTQPGFTSSIKSVKALCATAQAAQNQCPAASQVGSGQVVTNSLGTINLALALGTPQQHGDIATVYLLGKAAGSVLDLPARLLAAPGGGLELLVQKIPNVPLPGLQIESITLSARATNTVVTKTTKLITTGAGKHRKHHTKVTITRTTYSLLTNPADCPSTGAWTGTVTATFSSGPVTLPFTLACSGGSGTTGASGATGTSG